MRRKMHTLALACGIAALAGLAGLPRDAAAQGARKAAAAASLATVAKGGKPAAGAASAATATTKVASVGLGFEVPSAWAPVTPASPMRKAQFTLPSPKPGVEGGELVLFFFGAGQGGDAESNFERWTKQFAGEAGASPAADAKRGAFAVGALSVKTIEVVGTYVAETMPGSGQRQNKPGWRMLGAVVEGTGGPWFFKAVGPKETIAAAEAAFSAMLRSVKTAS